MYLETFSESVKPDPDLWISEWAEQKFQLAEYSAEKGNYRISRTPFIREILEVLSPQDPTQDIIVMKPTQLAGTTASLILICFGIDTNIGDMLMMMPTDNMVKRFSKKRLAKTILIMPDLSAKIGPAKSRDSANTILDKVFPGGSITLSGSNSGASYRSDTYRVVIGDDFDGFEVDIQGEGDPGELLDARTGSIRNCKVYKNSTPTLKDTSLIYREYVSSSQGKFCVPCPHCEELQYLTWGGADATFGIKFTRDNNGDILDVWYQCEFCRGRIDEHQKSWMFDRGKYIHKFPHRKKRGFHYNALYTPIGWKNTWFRLVEKFLIAKKELKEGQPTKMITFTNTMMAEVWEGLAERLSWEIISSRVEPYEERTVPADGLLLVCSVDTHDDRLPVLVRAWGRNEESWLVYHTELMGDPNHEDVWKMLDQILAAGYQRADGHVMKIATCAVDAMGHRTQAVYNYARTRFPRVIAIQGIPGDNKPIIGIKPTPVDVTYGGQTIKGGCHLWRVGTYQAKVTIYSRLNTHGQGAGVYHWPEGTTDDYFKQLTAERLTLKYIKGYPRYEWTKDPGRPNEALDLEVYNYAAALREGMNRPGFWDHIEKQYEKIKAPVEQKQTEKRNGFIPAGTGKGWFR